MSNIAKTRDDHWSPDGSIGSKIKRIRELRGLTQKQLGLRCGYSPSTADVRIAQYEKNKKMPREKALNDIANALNVDKSVFFDFDLCPADCMYHALFDLEDYHGLHPVQIDGKYYLEFSGQTSYGTEVNPDNYRCFLQKWDEMRQKHAPNESDSSEERKNKARNYNLWRIEYPSNEAAANSRHLDNLLKMDRLQAEIDETYADMMSEQELLRLDSTFSESLVMARESCTKITKESEFIYLLIELLAAGIDVKPYKPTEKIDYDHFYIVYFKTDNLIGNENAKTYFPRFLCAIESMLEYGLNIERIIMSKDKELYVSYRIDSSQSNYVSNVPRYWKDMERIAEFQRDGLPEWRIKEFDDELKAKICGDNDVIYTEM